MTGGVGVGFGGFGFLDGLGAGFGFDDLVGVIGFGDVVVVVVVVGCAGFAEPVGAASLAGSCGAKVFSWSGVSPPAVDDGVGVGVPCAATTGLSWTTAALGAGPGTAPVADDLVSAGTNSTAMPIAAALSR
ncbi:MAG: hypothetical protein QM619_06865 [Micropruina sp.]|uniref:hypothetical protein n=1 Tax=Micropruina sp. TaxID=2737536 RepID=UPI0039E277CD